jgi:nitroimidazol reductase NimA-like FMN-containing flavoprotein (pyridoxamine 5'-phosphate oxidase superfamily)
MKSAFELAMERLEQQAPTKSLSAEQKQELAELDRRYEAKIAERRVFLEGEIRKAAGTGEEDALRRQLSSEVARLQEELEEKKERARSAGS